VFLGVLPVPLLQLSNHQSACSWTSFQTEDVMRLHVLALLINFTVQPLLSPEQVPAAGAPVCGTLELFGSAADGTLFILCSAACLGLQHAMAGEHKRLYQNHCCPLVLDMPRWCRCTARQLATAENSLTRHRL
jgi:hypothetical protein